MSHEKQENKGTYMKFTFEDGFLHPVNNDKFIPKYSVNNLSEKRQLLFNKFLAKREVINSLLDEYIEFLDLEDLHTNEIEKNDLLEIVDQLKVALGCFDQILEDIYILDHRLKEEQLVASEAIPENISKWLNNLNR